MGLIGGVMIAGIAFGGACDEARGERGGRIEPAFGAQVSQLYQAMPMPGLAVVVMRGDQIIHDQALGYADMAKGTCLTTDHLMWSASVTKPFTAALFVKEAEARPEAGPESRPNSKPIDLQVPISAYAAQHGLPSPPNIETGVTFWDLLTQSSEGPKPGPYFIYGYRFNAVAYAYGSFDAFGAALSDQILAPLGLSAYARLDAVPDDQPIASPHQRLSAPDQTGFQVAPNQRWPRTIPATNLLISPKSLSYFGYVMNERQVVSAEGHGLLESPPKRNDKALAYAMGQFSTQIRGQRVFWQYGFGSASSVLWLRVPDLDLSLAVMSNSADLPAATRLGSGDLMRHPLMPAIVAHFFPRKQSQTNQQGQQTHSLCFASSVEDLMDDSVPDLVGGY